MISIKNNFAVGRIRTYAPRGNLISSQTLGHDCFLLLFKAKDNKCSIFYIIGFKMQFIDQNYVPSSVFHLKFMVGVHNVEKISMEINLFVFYNFSFMNKFRETFSGDRDAILFYFTPLSISCENICVPKYSNF